MASGGFVRVYIKRLSVYVGQLVIAGVDVFAALDSARLVLSDLLKSKHIDPVAKAFIKKYIMKDAAAKHGCF